MIRVKTEAAGRAHGWFIGTDARPPGDDTDALCRRMFRDAPAIAAIAERALHADPRFRAIRVRPRGTAGAIVIDGRIGEPRLLRVLDTFAHEWGGISVEVEVGERPAARRPVAANA
jgi:hypothetical protein